jgi:hypothetical protein
MAKDQVCQEAIDSVKGKVAIAMKETKRSRRVLLSKHSSGMCGLGKFMKRWQLRQDSACPHEAKVKTLHTYGNVEDEGRAIYGIGLWKTEKAGSTKFRS